MLILINYQLDDWLDATEEIDDADDTVEEDELTALLDEADDTADEDELAILLDADETDDAAEEATEEDEETETELLDDTDEETDAELLLFGLSSIPIALARATAAFLTAS